MKKYIVCNWKENPDSLEDAQRLFSATAETAENNINAHVVICPPAVFIEEMAKLYAGVTLGAQDCSAEESGAHTGEISLSMLKNFGVAYVIVGHSERRAMGETDKTINQKVLTCLAHNVRPILCVGEKSKDDDRQKIIGEQIQKDLTGVPQDKIVNILVAYEPIWAIGTGDAENAEHASEIMRYISGQLGGVSVLYGGSVNSENAESFLFRPEISGLLVGGASLNPEEISKIISMAK